MITEDYVSFETAKLLKEKGFDEQLCHFYTKKGLPIIYKTDKGVVWANNSKSEHAIVQPTLQMAMKWLREEKEIVIVIKPYPNEDGFCYVYEIKKLIGRDDFFIRKVASVENKAGFDSYEDACEAAIQYCLKHLI